jgi:hypothetical protein
MKDYSRIDIDRIRGYFDKKLKELLKYVDEHPPKGNIFIPYINSEVSRKIYIENEIENAEIYIGHYLDKCEMGLGILQIGRIIKEHAEKEQWTGVRRHLIYAKNFYLSTKKQTESFCSEPSPIPA